MNINHLFVPLGVDATPIGLRKCIDPVTGLSTAYGLAQGLGSFISNKEGNAMNYQLQLDTNRLNKQMADEANEMSQAQFEKNLEWLREQYYDTNQYARLREAAAKGGFNPALAMGEVKPVGSVGQASPTSFHAAQFEAPHLDSVSLDPLAQTIGRSVDSFFDNQLKSAQTENLAADSQIKQAQAFTEFASRVADIRSKYADIEYKLAQKGVSEATRNKLISEKDEIDSRLQEFWSLWDERQKAAKFGNKILERQEKGLELDNALKEIEKQFKPVLLKANIKLSQSHSKQLLALADNLVEEAKNNWHYRNDIMPLEVIQKKLANGISAIVFNGSKSYEDFLKDEDMSDFRNFIKLFGELLFRLAK